MATTKEAAYEMAAYEGAIDYLANLGYIDRGRVGIIGFSRTGQTVKYTLTHSNYRFAAATVADGNDAGYFQYLSVANSYPVAAADDEALNGGAPFGDGLASWLKNSPSFALARVFTPVRLEANQPGSLAWAWEWFAGLSRLNKPVDLMYMPDATHVLVKPWNRMASQQGNVDWFDFWLNDFEDGDPAKARQYARWRKLRKLQEQNNNVAAQH